MRWDSVDFPSYSKDWDDVFKATNFLSGHVEFGNIKAEKWKHTVSGKPGEMGGAKGEALVFRHELLLTRGANNFAMPLQ